MTTSDAASIAAKAKQSAADLKTQASAATSAGCTESIKVINSISKLADVIQQASDAGE